MLVIFLIIVPRLLIRLPNFVVGFCEYLAWLIHLPGFFERLCAVFGFRVAILLLDVLDRGVIVLATAFPVSGFLYFQNVQFILERTNDGVKRLLHGLRFDSFP